MNTASTTWHMIKVGYSGWSRVRWDGLVTEKVVFPRGWAWSRRYNMRNGERELMHVEKWTPVCRFGWCTADQPPASFTPIPFDSFVQSTVIYVFSLIQQYFSIPLCLQKPDTHPLYTQTDPHSTGRSFFSSALSKSGNTDSWLYHNCCNIRSSFFYTGLNGQRVETSGALSITHISFHLLYWGARVVVGRGEGWGGALQRSRWSNTHLHAHTHGNIYTCCDQAVRDAPVLIVVIYCVFIGPLDRVLQSVILSCGTMVIKRSRSSEINVRWCSVISVYCSCGLLHIKGMCD